MHGSYNTKFQHTCNECLRKTGQKDWERGKIQGDMGEHFVGLDRI